MKTITVFIIKNKKEFYNMPIRKFLLCYTYENGEGKGKIMNQKIAEMLGEMNQVILGKEEVVKNCLVALLAGGHVLIEDVPGVGKTTLAKTLAAVSGCDYGRIQFTPDTLPSDVTGVSIYQKQTEKFEYMPGAIMHSIVLADEINRTSPKTQASLLEAMEEKQVSVDGQTYKLPEPFMVIATQNPLDQVGTYRLPEAQLDRFLMKLTMGYPNREREQSMMKEFLFHKEWKEVRAVSNAQEIELMRQDVTGVQVSEDIMGYVEELLDKTRKNSMIRLGASPRAGLALLRATQALAYVENRDFVTPDDIIGLINPVLGHRMILSQEAEWKNQTPERVLASIRVEVKVPV